jgi:hypothetical protein
MKNSNQLESDCLFFFLNFFLMRLGVPQAILLIMATPSGGF